MHEHGTTAPHARRQLRWSCASCHALIDQLLDRVSQAPLGDAQGLLRDVDRLRRRVDAVRLRVIAAADQSGIPDTKGHASTGSWISRHTCTDGRAAAQDAILAEALGNAAPTPPAVNSTDLTGPHLSLADTTNPEPVRTPTGVALDAGRISAEHARIIVRTLAELPDWVTPSQRAQCEHELVRLAAGRTPAKLRPVARRILSTVLPPDQHDMVDAHENTQLEAEEQRAWDTAAFWIRDNHDGTMTGHFTVPTTAGLTLRKIIDAMVAPRRHTAQRPGGMSTTSAGTRATTTADTTSTGARSFGEGQSDWKLDQLDWQHRKGQAFTDLLLHLPTDHLHDKTAATIIVTTRLDDLRADLTKAGTVDTGHTLSAGDTRRLACQAGIIPALLDTTSVPLDLGRITRCFTTTQRAALATRYTECATDGCDRPYAWSELHHLTPWSTGGTTNLANAIPLCGHHHRRLHHGHPHHLTRDHHNHWILTFHTRC